MEAERGMVGGSRHGVVVSKHHGAGVRPSQLIASVGLTWRGSPEWAPREIEGPRSC